MAITPGQAAYEKWCENINPPQLPKQHALAIQPWGKLRRRTQAVWVSIAQAAIEQHAKKRGT